jgi:hypothetical protein
VRKPLEMGERRLADVLGRPAMCAHSCGAR